ncbi:Uncharacterised protein [Mycobacterium tuberculosis]|nr:Uncharacterised protein [Mycobacterium tuberculosis]
MKPAMSANSTEASSYLSATIVVCGFLSRAAMLVGKMLVSNASERACSSSIARWAPSISRCVYHTVAMIIPHAATAEIAKPRSIAQTGCALVRTGRT